MVSPVVARPPHPPVVWNEIAYDVDAGTESIAYDVGGSLPSCTFLDTVGLGQTMSGS